LFAYFVVLLLKKIPKTQRSIPFPSPDNPVSHAFRIRFSVEGIRWQRGSLESQLSSLPLTIEPINGIIPQPFSDKLTSVHTGEDYWLLLPEQQRLQYLHQLHEHVHQARRKASFIAFHRLLLQETDPLPWFLCHTNFLTDSQRLELLYVDLGSASFWARKARRLLDEQRYVIRYLAHFQSLSEREKHVITLVARGFNNPAIANELGIARPTVETHRKNIYRKLDLHSVPELVRFALAFELG